MSLTFSQSSVKRFDRVLLVLAASHGLSHVVPASLGPLLPLIKMEYNLSYTLVGIITSILSLGWGFTSIPLGLACDKFNKVKILSFMFLIIGLFSGFLLLAKSLLTVLPLLMAIYVSLAVFHPAAQSYLSQRYPRKRGKIFGLFESGANLGRIGAILTAGIVGSALGWRSVYGLWSGLSIVTGLMVYSVCRSNSGDLSAKTLSSPGRRTSLITKPISRKTLVRSLYVSMGLFGFITAPIGSFLPIFWTEEWGFSVRAAGYGLAVFLIGGTIAQIWAGKYLDKWGRAETIRTCFLISVFSLGFISLLQNALALFGLLFISGFALFLILPSITLLTAEVEKTRLGFAYGVQVFLGAGFSALGNLLCGYVSDMWGVRYVFFVLSAAALVGAVFSWSRLPRKSHLDHTKA